MPYREVHVEPVAPRRALDPWKLALIFAWVCDIGRVGIGMLDRRPVAGELGFAALLGVTTLVVVVSSLRDRSSRRKSHVLATGSTARR